MLESCIVRIVCLLWCECMRVALIFDLNARAPGACWCIRGAVVRTAGLQRSQAWQ